MLIDVPVSLACQKLLQLGSLSEGRKGSGRRHHCNQLLTHRKSAISMSAALDLVSKYMSLFGQTFGEMLLIGIAQAITGNHQRALSHNECFITLMLHDLSLL